MDLDPLWFYDTVSRVVIALAVCVFVLLLVIDAPYGRYVSDAWGPTLPARIQRDDMVHGSEVTQLRLPNLRRHGPAGHKHQSRAGAGFDVV